MYSLSKPACISHSTFFIKTEFLEKTADSAILHNALKTTFPSIDFGRLLVCHLDNLGSGY